MKEIDSRTKGFWQPTPGGVYPILRDLEKSGFIKGRWDTQKNRRLKIYKVTPSGEIILKRAIEKQSEILNNIGSLFREFASAVLNVKPTDSGAPEMPSPLAPFFADNPNSQKTLKELERQRKFTKERLKQIDQRMREIKKQTVAQPNGPSL